MKRFEGGFDEVLICSILDVEPVEPSYETGLELVNNAAVLIVLRRSQKTTYEPDCHLANQGV